MQGSVEDTGPNFRLQVLEAEITRNRDRLHDHANRLQDHDTLLEDIEEHVTEMRGVVYGKDGILSELAKINRSISIAGIVVTCFLIPILVGVVKMSGLIK